MRTSHIEMQRRIEKTKVEIPDEKIFVDGTYAAYLTDLAVSATSRYKRKCAVKVFWDETPGADVGYTDSKVIVINAANFLSQSFPTRPLRSLSLIGILGHEIGHMLYSDFSRLHMAERTMKKGIVYPGKISFKKYSYKANIEEMKEWLKDEERQDGIISCYMELNNILEDAYIEARMCHDFPGTYRSGITLNNVRLSEIVPSIEKMLEQEWPEYSICAQLAIQYCKTGDINAVGDSKAPCVEAFYEALEYIDEAIYDNDAAARFKGALYLCGIFWPYIKEIAEKKKESENLTGASPSAKGSGKPIAGSGFFEPDFDAIDKERSTAKEVISSHCDRMALIKTDSLKTSGSSSVTYNKEFEGSGYGAAASDISRLLTDMASKEVLEAMEQELTEELIEERKKIDFGNAHKDVPLMIQRIGTVSEELKNAYSVVLPTLRPIAKRLAAQIKKLQESKGGKEKGLLMGKRVQPGSFHRRDGRHFTKDTLPMESLDLAVGLLIDESGSMGCGDRATYARAASVVIYEFCRILRIPVIIYGHSTDYDEDSEEEAIALYAYAEFDSVDNQDAFRLMDISARSNNRDGAALRFVAERLHKRREKERILILISDGQPAASGYGGTKAEADLRGIKLEYNRKGIHLIAAAIGSDKENIQRIYGDSFLDITNLNQLHIKLTEIVKTYMHL